MTDGGRTAKPGGLGTLILLAGLVGLAGGAVGLFAGMWLVQYVRYFDDGGIYSIGTLVVGALTGAVAGVVTAIKFWKSGD